MFDSMACAQEALSTAHSSDLSGISVKLVSRKAFNSVAKAYGFGTSWIRCIEISLVENYAA